MTAPKLRFPTSDELEVSSWQEISLSNLAQEIFSGGTPPKQHTEYWSGNLPWVSSSDLFLNDIHSIKLSKFITKEAVKNSATKKVPKGSVLVVSRVGVGKVALAKEDLYTSQDFTNIITPSCDSTFLAYSLSKMMAKKVTSVQGSAIKGIPSEEIKEYHIRVPRKEEQQKIAAFFTALDEKIAISQKQLLNLKDVKKGVLEKIFNQEVCFKRSDGTPYPAWSTYSVEDVFKLSRGYVLSTKEVEENKTETMKYPVYSSQTQNDGLMGFYSSYIYNDSITWTTDGANAGTVRFRKGEFYCTNVCGVLTNKTGYSNLCIAEMLNCVAKKHVSYVGNPKLMNNVMAKIVMKYPSVEEQKNISEFIELINKKILNKEVKVMLLTKLKKGFMQQMFV